MVLYAMCISLYYGVWWPTLCQHTEYATAENLLLSSVNTINKEETLMPGGTYAPFRCICCSVFFFVCCFHTMILLHLIAVNGCHWMLFVPQTSNPFNLNIERKRGMQCIENFNLPITRKWKISYPGCPKISAIQYSFTVYVLCLMPYALCPTKVKQTILPNEKNITKQRLDYFRTVSHRLPA